MATFEGEGDFHTDGEEDYLHAHHARQKLKQLFVSRKSLFNNRVKPVDSDEDTISIVESLIEANKNIPHAGLIKEEKRRPESFNSWAATSSLTWAAFPEILFIILSLLNIIFASYILMMGLTGLSWKSSVDSVVYEVAELPGYLNEEVTQKVLREQKSGYQMVKDVNVHSLGIVLFAVGLIHFINIVTGCQVAFRGLRNGLIVHTIIAFLLLVCECIPGYIMYSGVCNSTTFSNRFIEHTANFYESKADSKLKVDAIQKSIGCCGADNWTDYFRNFPNSDAEDAERLDLAGDQVMFPSSCCNSWWARNLQCADQVHFWPKETIDDQEIIGRRIMTRGCISEVETMCRTIVVLMGTGVLIATVGQTILFFFIAICVILQIKVINAMVEENFQKGQQAEDLCMGIFDDDSDITMKVGPNIDFEITSTASAFGQEDDKNKGKLD